MQGGQSLDVSRIAKDRLVLWSKPSQGRLRGIVSLSRELSLGNLNPQADKPEHRLFKKKDANPHFPSKKNKQNAVCYNRR